MEKLLKIGLCMNYFQPRLIRLYFFVLISGKQSRRRPPTIEMINGVKTMATTRSPMGWIVDSCRARINTPTHIDMYAIENRNAFQFIVYSQHVAIACHGTLNDKTIETQILRRIYWCFCFYLMLNNDAVYSLIASEMMEFDYRLADDDCRAYLAKN